MPGARVKGMQMRRQPTAEQAEAAKARREKMRTLARRISELSQEEREALAARAGIRSIEGRPLSVFNSCMLISQHEGVSVVGGFQQWRRAGRHVMKGHRGLAIWIPIGNGSETPTAAEASGDGEESGKSRRFVLGTVFDITQTSAEHEVVDQAEGELVPVLAGEVFTPRSLPMPSKCAECGCKLADGACPLCGVSAQVAA